MVPSNVGLHPKREVHMLHSSKNLLHFTCFRIMSSNLCVLRLMSAWSQSPKKPCTVSANHRKTVQTITYKYSLIYRTKLRQLQKRVQRTQLQTIATLFHFWYLFTKQRMKPNDFIKIFESALKPQSILYLEMIWDNLRFIWDHLEMNLRSSQDCRNIIFILSWYYLEIILTYLRQSWDHLEAILRLSWDESEIIWDNLKIISRWMSVYPHAALIHRLLTHTHKQRWLFLTCFCLQKIWNQSRRKTAKFENSHP